MFAVIKTGGKQYRVNKDEIISIERLQGDAGSKIVFDEVLMLGEDGKAPTIGAPLIAGATVPKAIVNFRHW